MALNWDKIYQGVGLERERMQPTGVDFNELYRKLDERYQPTQATQPIQPATEVPEERKFLQRQAAELQTFVAQNKAQELKDKYGYNLDELKANTEALSKAIDAASKFEYHNIRRWNRAKERSEQASPVGRFFNRISQAGAATILGEQIPEELKIQTGGKVADVGASLVGGIGGLATPISAGQSLLGAGTRAGEVAGQQALRLPGRAGQLAASPLGQRLIRGTTAGALIDVGTGIRQEEDTGELTRRIVEGALVGGAIDVATFGIGKLARNIMGRYGEAPEEIIEAINDIERSKVNQELRDIDLDQTNYEQQVKKLVDYYGNEDIINAIEDYEVATAVKRDLGIDIEEFKRLRPEEAVEQIRIQPSAIETPQLPRPDTADLPAIQRATQLEIPTREQPQQLQELQLPGITERLEAGAIAAEEATDAQRRMLGFPQTVEDSFKTSSELDKLIKKNPSYYNPTSNVEQIRVANEILDQDMEAARNYVLQGRKFASDIEPVMGQQLMDRLQQQERYDDAFEVMQAISRKYKIAGREIQTATLWRRTTPSGMAKFVDKIIDSTNEKLPVGKEIKLTTEDRRKIFEEMEVITKMPDSREKDVAIALLLKQFTDKIPVSLGRKIGTAQAISHLLNIKTTLRNLFGNIAFGVIEQFSRAWGTPFDIAQAQKTGKRTLALPVLTKETFDDALLRAREAAEEIRLGIDLKGGGKYGITTPAFRKGPLASLEKGLAYALKVPDEFFKGIFRKQTTDQLISLSGLKQADEAIKQQAAEEASYATFQDNKLPAIVLQGFKELLNKIPLGKISGRQIPGQQLRYTREFGIGDFLIKYAKTPGNIMSRGIEYTPLGLIRALLIGLDSRKAAIPQREISLAIGRALNGTSLIALGAYLHKKQILISQDKKRDKDAKALESAEGLGNYKVNIDALNRVLSGEDSSPMKGDKLESYNWLQPVSVALAIGGTISSELEKEGTPLEITEDALNSSFEELLDLPTMFVIKSMVYESMKSDSSLYDVLSVPAVQAIPGFVPSPVRQLGQALDPVARQRTAQTTTERAIEGVQMALPGFREELPARLDPLGQPITYESGIQALVKPSIGTTYDPYPFTRQLKQLEDVTGETTQYPQSRPPKSVKPKGLPKIILSPEQQNRFMEISGAIIEREYTNALQGLNVDTLTDLQRTQLISALEKIQREARTLAKNRIIREINQQM